MTVFVLRSKVLDMYKFVHIQLTCEEFYIQNITSVFKDNGINYIKPCEFNRELEQYQIMFTESQSVKYA